MNVSFITSCIKFSVDKKMSRIPQVTYTFKLASVYLKKGKFYYQSNIHYQTIIASRGPISTQHVCILLI